MKVTRRMASVQRSGEQLTQHLGPLMDTSVPLPNAGWIRATRDALGMTAAQLAARMGISRSLISRFEAGEKSGTIKLDTLKRIAEAMDCSLVYAFVPNGESYEAVLNHQAQHAASGPSGRVLHTMALEDQGPNPVGAARIRDQITADLIESGRVWDS